MIDQCQQSYLLRLWRNHSGAPWRATLVDVAHADEHRHFATLDLLYAFLNEQASQMIPRPFGEAATTSERSASPDRPDESEEP